MCSCTHFLRFFHGIVELFLSVALPLVCGRNADGAEGHDRHLSSVIAVDFRPHIDTFDGWYDKDGNRYDASSVYSVKGDTTLTARWIENGVQTGDGFPIFLLSGAMMAASAGAVMLLLKRRKLMGE